MKYYIVVKLEFVGELYDVGGPYDTREEAEDELDIQHSIWHDSLDEDEYLSVVSRRE